MLAKLQADTDELSLCFDPSAGVIRDHDEGNELFDENSEPTEYTKGVLDFCQKFEESGARTKAFMEELKKHSFIDGEIAITLNQDPDKPFVSRF